MHPAEEIFCEKSNKLRGKTVVIGITGSIAAMSASHRSGSSYATGRRSSR